MATKLPPKKSTDELQIDCEVAAEVIAEYFAYCAKQLAEERDTSSPNQEKIEALESQLRELKREKMSLGVENSDVIKKALYIYAPLLKRTKV
jgi:hypothetical protein